MIHDETRHTKDPLDRFIRSLQESGADGWEITDTKTRGWEFYFIRHRLDQNRAKDVEHISMKVYKRSGDGSEVGIASAEVPATADDDELKKTAADLVYQATLVMNKAFRMNQPARCDSIAPESLTLMEDAEAFIRAMEGVRETETEYINSYEIFVNRNVRRLVTSEGIDVTEEYPSAVLDVVVNAREDKPGGREVELYRIYDLGTCDQQQVREDIEELLRYGRDRLAAQPTPDLGTAEIVLSTDAALEVYGYFISNLDASYAVRGMSRFSIGEPAADDIQGDRITIRTVRELPGSPKNWSCDTEGAPVRDEVLMEKSVPLRYAGNRMFSQYMDIEDSFIVTNWSVSGGTESSVSIREGRFLEIVEFSDFQVDGMTGDIFGEIRLAYYHDGEGGVTAVSGGSVSGSMADNLAHMHMTEQTRRYANAEIPAATRLENITVSGC